MKDKTVQVQVFGKVQGVCFRDYTRRKAEELDLNGWVKNCRDGSVETLLSGEAERVDQMIEWLHEGSPYSDVARVEVCETSPDQTLTGFNITF